MGKNELSAKHKRSERIFYAIQLATACIVAVLFYYLPTEYGLAASLWLIHNAFAYHRGKYEHCVDEYEHEGYPSFGLERMLDTWRWNIPILLIAVFAIPFFSSTRCISAMFVYFFILLIAYVDN